MTGVVTSVITTRPRVPPSSTVVWGEAHGAAAARRRLRSIDAAMPAPVEHATFTVRVHRCASVKEDEDDERRLLSNDAASVAPPRPTSSIALDIFAPGIGGAGSTGGRVWSSSVLMLEELGKRPGLVANKACVEFGAGLGLVGIGAACLGAHVCVTDGDEDCVRAARENIERNAAAIRTAGGSAVARLLRWSDAADGSTRRWRHEDARASAPEKKTAPEGTGSAGSSAATTIDPASRASAPPFDVALFSDCVYTDGGVEDLIGAIASLLCRPSEDDDVDDDDVDDDDEEATAGGEPAVASATGTRGGGAVCGVAGVRQRHLLSALVAGLDRRGFRLATGGIRALTPTPECLEIASTHQADMDITERKSGGGYAWVEAYNE